MATCPICENSIPDIETQLLGDDEYAFTYCEDCGAYIGKEKGKMVEIENPRTKAYLDLVGEDW